MGYNENMITVSTLTIEELSELIKAYMAYCKSEERKTPEIPTLEGFGEWLSKGAPEYRDPDGFYKLDDISF